MDRAAEITGKIEHLVENGEVGVGQIIAVNDIPLSLATQLREHYVSDRRFSVEEVLILNADNPEKVHHTFYFGYKGGEK